MRPFPIWSVTNRTHVTTWRHLAVKWDDLNYTGGRASYPLDRWRK